MKKLVLLGMVMMMALGSLFASGRSDTKGGTTIVYWSMWNEAEPQGQVIAQAATAFTKETGIKIDVNFNGRDIRKTLQPALDAGEAIDMFDEDIDRVAVTWGSYLLPLDSYIGKTYPSTGGKAWNSVVNKTLIDLAKQLGGGQVKNIPYQPFVFTTMYNKDLFKQAGVTETPKNWDEFLAVCAKLKAAGITPITVDDAYMAALFGYCMDRMVGSDAASAMVKNNDFKGPQVLEFGKIWENMAKNGYISPKAASNIYPAGQIEEVAAGKVAMYLNGTWLPNEIKMSAPNLNWGAFAWPAMGGGDGISANNFGGQSFGINKNSKHPDETFQFIAYLTSGKWDIELARESIGIPMGNDSAWPTQLAEAKPVIDNTTKRLPWAVSMEDSADVNAKIKSNFAKLILGQLSAEQFAAEMGK